MEPTKKTREESRFLPQGWQSQQGSLRLPAARKSLNNMVILVCLKQVLKHLSEQSDAVQMPLLHGHTRGQC